MNKKKIGEKTDSLLEAEMIKEAKMIEESLLGNAANDFEISDEELDEAYQQFLKKMKACLLYTSGLFCCCFWGIVVLFLSGKGTKTEMPFVPFLMLGYIGGLIY